MARDYEQTTGAPPHAAVVIDDDPALPEREALKLVGLGRALVRALLGRGADGVTADVAAWPASPTAAGQLTHSENGYAPAMTVIHGSTAGTPAAPRPVTS